jgi:hypothetical protein
VCRTVARLQPKIDKKFKCLIFHPDKSATCKRYQGLALAHHC